MAEQDDDLASPGRSLVDEEAGTGTAAFPMSQSNVNDEQTEQTLHTAMSAVSTTDPISLSPSSHPAVGAIDTIASRAPLIQSLDTGANGAGPKLKLADVGPIFNEHARLIHELIERNNELTKDLVVVERANVRRQLEAEQRISNLETNIARLSEKEDDGSDVQVNITRTPAKRNKQPVGKAKPRTKNPKPDDQNQLTNFIHYSFHDKVGKVYPEIKNYPGWLVIAEPGIESKWPPPLENGESRLTVSHGPHPTREGEQVTSRRYRPLWGDKKADSSEDLVAAVLDATKAKFPNKDGDRLKRMVDAYFVSASKLYEQEWRIGDTYTSSVAQKRADRRTGRRRTILTYRFTGFDTSSLALCQKSMRYRLALCRTDDIVVPDYLSDEDTDVEAERRYSVYDTEDPDVKMLERDYFIRTSLGLLASAADVWEVKDLWWISEELREAAMMLDAHYYVKANVSPGKLWRGPSHKWNPPTGPGPLPPVRPKREDGRPEVGIAGYVIYRWMVNTQRVLEVPAVPNFVASLFEDLPLPPNAPALSAKEAISQAGFEKVKKVFTAMWKQYRSTQEDKSEEDIKTQLADWEEQDAAALAQSTT